jgi:tyrosyl-tRNA synthetase
MDFLADLEARGLIQDSTDRDALRHRLAAGPIKMYVGFDPTADSLHIGNLVGQIMMRRFQDAGHQPFPLAGGATGMIGDPGGRSAERNLLDRETLEANVASIKGQLSMLLDFSPGPTQATLVNNADWTEPMGVLDFLRDVGKLMTVNQMIAKESVRSRIDSEHGISFTEFSYMLLQGNDYRHLHAMHGVEMQMGGSDQWGNILTGVDMIRRRDGASAHAATWPLITNASGAKFGKSTGGGGVWLSSKRTSPYQFRQFWMQVHDVDIGGYLMKYSLRSVSAIEALISAHDMDPGKRTAQRALADEMTELLHGRAAADAADAAAAVLFGGDPTGASLDALAVVASEVPAGPLPDDWLGDPVAMLVGCGLATSNGEARRLLEQKSVRANGTVLDRGSATGPGNLLHGRYLLVRRGKSSYFLADRARNSDHAREGASS